jgi:hypothetical protein
VPIIRSPSNKNSDGSDDYVDIVFVKSSKRKVTVVYANVFGGKNKVTTLGRLLFFVLRTPVAGSSLSVIVKRGTES